MAESIKPTPGTGDFQTAAPEQLVNIPLAFRDDDAFIINLTIAEVE